MAETNDSIIAATKPRGCKCRPRASAGATIGIEGIVQVWEPEDVLERVQFSNQLPDFRQTQPQQWRNLCTPAMRANRPLKLSLERDAIGNDELVVNRQYDVDAIFIRLKHLGAFRKGFHLGLISKFSRVISQGWHANFQPHRTKHVRLGYGHDHTAWKTYMFFPNMPLNSGRDGEGVCQLDEGQQAFLVDAILLPALQAIASDHEIAHMPRSSAEAFAASWAHVKEAQTGRNSTAGQSEAEVFLPFEMLGAFYDQVKRALNRPTTPDQWHDAFMWTYTVGTKARFRAANPQAVLRKLRDVLSDHFHSEHIDLSRSMVDCAYEDLAEDKQGNLLCLVRKSQCNKSTVASFGTSMGYQVYPWQGTADGSAITMEPRSSTDHFKNGVHYVQSYNLSKDMFWSANRSAAPLFSAKWLTNLAYSAAQLDLLQRRNNHNRGQVDNTASRRRYLIVLKNMILRANAALSACENAESLGFGARQEFRLRFDLAELFLADERLQINASLRREAQSHWPYYAFRREPFLRFIRANINRFLMPFVLIATRPRNTGTTASLLMPMDIHHDAATLAVFKTCLDIVINGAPYTRKSRVALATYVPRIEDEDEEGTSDAEDGAADVGERGNRERLGLDMISCISDYGIVNVPVDQFQWSQVRFKTEVLRRSGWSTTEFRAHSRNTTQHAQNDTIDAFASAKIETLNAAALPTQLAAPLPASIKDVFECLYQIVYFLYAKEIIPALVHAGLFRQPTVDGVFAGHFGLSYALVKQLSFAAKPEISKPRQTGGQSKAGTGLSLVPLTFERRLRLLFDWQDGQQRDAWESKDFRSQAKRIYEMLEQKIGNAWAERWRTGLGTGRAATWLTVFPATESGKFFKRIQPKKNNSEVTKAFRADTPQPVLLAGLARDSGSDPGSTTWELVTTQAHVLRLEAAGSRPAYVARPFDKIGPLLT